MKDNNFIRKILVPVDGSNLSIQAEKTAAIAAKNTGATVTVLYVKTEMEEYYRSFYAIKGVEYGISHDLIKKILDLTEKEAKSCKVCGKHLCPDCINKVGLIFKKKLCNSCLAKSK